jgi:hypothetical protein
MVPWLAHAAGGFTARIPAVGHRAWTTVSLGQENAVKSTTPDTRSSIGELRPALPYLRHKRVSMPNRPRLDKPLKSLEKKLPWQLAPDARYNSFLFLFQRVAKGAAFVGRPRRRHRGGDMLNTEDSSSVQSPTSPESPRPHRSRVAGLGRVFSMRHRLRESVATTGCAARFLSNGIKLRGISRPRIPHPRCPDGIDGATGTDEHTTSFNNQRRKTEISS